MNYTRMINIMAQQKQALGMSEALIAARSGVSQPTVHRILSGRHHRAAWSDIAGIADVLGVSIGVEVEPAPRLLERKAHGIARRIAHMTQATSQMEGQGVSDHEQQEMIRETEIELLAGPKRKLWTLED